MANNTQQVTSNIFNGGLLKDIQELTTPNNVLSDCLNGTILTYNGNEFVLQNDLGNARIENCRLKKDFIPLGMKEYGGVIYIVSHNPFTGESEIGSFPSPQRIIDSKDGVKLDSSFSAEDLYVDLSKKDTLKDSLKVDLEDVIKLGPGDKFYLYARDLQTFETLKRFITIKDANGEVVHKVFRMNLVCIDEDNNIEYISDDNIDTYIKSDNATGIDEREYKYKVYTSKLNGYLAYLIELEKPIFVSYDIVYNATPSQDTYNATITVSTSPASEKEDRSLKWVTLTTTEEDGTVKEIEKEIPLNASEISHTYTDLNMDKQYTLDVSVYSKFTKFPEYNFKTVLDYSKSKFTADSGIWQYLKNPKSMTLTFDFVVQNPLNGKNKCDAMYLEFYDVYSNVSLIYPLSEISSFKSFSIPFFEEGNKELTPNNQNGGYGSGDIITGKGFYILLNKSKRTEFNLALSTGDFSKLAENKDFYIAYPYFTDRLINSQNNPVEDLNKLRKDNFYVVRISGVDIYTTSTGVNVKEYNSYNFMWTNGYFNTSYNTGSEYDNNFNNNSHSISRFVSPRLNVLNNFKLTKDNSVVLTGAPTSISDYYQYTIDRFGNLISPTPKQINCKQSFENTIEAEVSVVEDLDKYFKYGTLTNENPLYSSLTINPALVSQKEVIETITNNTGTPKSSIDNQVNSSFTNVSISGEGRVYTLKGDISSNRLLYEEQSLNSTSYKRNVYKELATPTRAQIASNTFDSSNGIAVGARGIGGAEVYMYFQTLDRLNLTNPAPMEGADTITLDRDIPNYQMQEMFNAIPTTSCTIYASRYAAYDAGHRVGIGTRVDGTTSLYDFAWDIDGAKQTGPVPVNSRGESYVWFLIKIGRTLYACSRYEEKNGSGTTTINGNDMVNRLASNFKLYNPTSVPASVYILDPNTLIYHTGFTTKYTFKNTYFADAVYDDVYLTWNKQVLNEDFFKSLKSKVDSKAINVTIGKVFSEGFYDPTNIQDSYGFGHFPHQSETIQIPLSQDQLYYDLGETIFNKFDSSFMKDLINPGNLLQLEDLGQGYILCRAANGNVLLDSNGDPIKFTIASYNETTQRIDFNTQAIENAEQVYVWSGNGNSRGPSPLVQKITHAELNGLLFNTNR